MSSSEALMEQINNSLSKANPKKEIRQYGLMLLKSHHETIRKEHYLQYWKMIHKFAYHYHRQYKLDLEELTAEGNLIYYWCFQAYIKKNHLCSFSTFLFNNLKSKLRWYCRRQMKRITINEEIEAFHIADRKNDFERKIIFECCLSEKSKKIVNLVLEHNDTFAFYLETGKPTRQNLSQYLKNEGWRNKDIQQSFAEIKNALR